MPGSPTAMIVPLGNVPLRVLFALKNQDKSLVASLLQLGGIRLALSIRCLAIEEEHFLEVARALAALAKVRCFYFKSEFCTNSLQFPEDLVPNVKSTEAARSFIAQGLRSFWPEINIGGDDYSAFYVLWQLLDRLLERNWIKRSLVEPSRKASFRPERAEAAETAFHEEAS